MRVGLYDSPVFREHDPGPTHPERRQRLDAVRDGLRREGLEPRLALIKPRPATPDELRSVHTADHVAFVLDKADAHWVFDADTVASPRSVEAALLAAGAMVDAVDRVLDGELDRAFCAVRPPGHHAEPDRARGFCLFNNVAVGAARALARGLQRVLIVDWDVHHGNGTQAAFASDPRVLYVSSHAWPFYPGTGGLDEVGEGAGIGYTVNIPLPAGCGDGEYVAAYREIVAPVAHAFDPELVLVSCGFDPHADDPLAGMEMTATGFDALAGLCLDMAGGAAGGRVIVVLEGGYDLPAIAASSARVVARLLGDAGAEVTTPAAPGIARLLDHYRATLARQWPVLTGGVPA